MAALADAPTRARRRLETGASPAPVRVRVEADGEQPIGARPARQVRDARTPSAEIAQAR
jgi:hypothetical protein